MKLQVVWSSVMRKFCLWIVREIPEDSAWKDAVPMVLLGEGLPWKSKRLGLADLEDTRVYSGGTSTGYPMGWTTVLFGSVGFGRKQRT